MTTNTNTTNTRARNAQGRFAKSDVVDAIEVDAHSAYTDERFTAFSELFDEMPEVVRPWGGLIAGLLASLGCGWLIGFAVELLITAAMALTGSAVVAYLIWFFGLVASIYAGVRVGTQATAYVALGGLDRDIEQAKGWATEKLSTLRGAFSGFSWSKA